MRIGMTLEENPEEESQGASEPGKYRVSLMLGVVDPEHSALVDVWMQGERVAQGLELTSAGTTQTFEGVSIGDALELSFETKAGGIVLHGLELERQGGNP